MATATQDTLARIGIAKQQLPLSWRIAAGLLKRKKINGLAYQRKIRSEWEHRIRKQVKLAKNGR